MSTIIVNKETVGSGGRPYIDDPATRPAAGRIQVTSLFSGSILDVTNMNMNIFTMSTHQSVLQEVVLDLFNI